MKVMPTLSLGLILVGLNPATSTAQVIVPPHSVVEGRTLGEWSAVWWQWEFSIPADRNPWFDPDGHLATNDQSGPVFFLTGVANIPDNSVVRTSTVPENKYLFFPILNMECDNVGAVHPLSADELWDGLFGYLAIVYELYASVDGVSVPDPFDYLELSPVFAYWLPTHNIYEAFGMQVPSGWYEPVVAGGYWIMLEPLSPGPHVIRFWGISGSPGYVSLDVTYHLTVAGTNRPVETVAPIPREDFWVPDGPIYSLLETNGLLFVGGDFSYFGPREGTGAALDLYSGTPDPLFPKVSGVVNTVIPDGAGGWFLGGLFNAVGGFARANLVHIRPDKSVDPDWSAGTDDEVLVLTLAENRLYLGGGFSTVAGEPRHRIAAVEAASGVLTDWDPNAFSVTRSGEVRALAMAGNTVYAAGTFERIGGQPRLNLAALETATGQATDWIPIPVITEETPQTIDALALVNTTLYAGGDFVAVNENDPPDPNDQDRPQSEDQHQDRRARIEPQPDGGARPEGPDQHQGGRAHIEPQPERGARLTGTVDFRNYSG